MKFDSTQCAISWGMALFFSSSVAFANGRFPATSAVVVQPTNPKSMALRATYGLLISNDAGQHWDWICERAIGFSGNEDPPLVLTRSGAMVVGTFDGASRSIDGGCHWSHDASWPKNVIDLTTRPQSSDRVYAITNAFSKMNDAGSNLYASELFVSEDAGAHWSSLAKFDPTLLIDSVEVAPSDSKRVYVSAVRDGQGVLLVSDDDGARWKQHEIKLISQERGAYVAAVDPKNAARIYLRTASADSSRLLVSENAGVSFRELSHGSLLQGFALADDGATIFAGDQSGLARASSKDDRFDRVSTSPIQCLTVIGSDLWACTPTTAGYVLGASSDHGVTFSSKLAFGGMRGPLQCASPSSMDVCADDWSALQSLVAPSKSTDASVAPSASARPKIEEHSTFGCAFVGGSHAERSSIFAIAFAALAFFARRFRSTKQG